MNIFNKLLLTVLLSVFTIAGAFSQVAVSDPKEKTLIFKFIPRQDMFYRDGNVAELNRLDSLVDEYHTEIAAGRMFVYVNGYCTSLESYEDNLQMLAVRSNRVNAELVTKKGLIDSNFIINNHYGSISLVADGWGN